MTEMFKYDSSMEFFLNPASSVTFTYKFTLNIQVKTVPTYSWTYINFHSKYKEGKAALVKKERGRKCDAHRVKSS